MSSPDHMGLVFVVDDERLQCRALRRHLIAAGYCVHTFTRAADALEATESESPDAIITDYDMPEMNGVELRAALSNVYGRRMPVCILISAALHDVPADDVRRFDGWISKPIDVRRLLDQLHARLRFRRRLRSGVQPRQPIADQKKSGSS